jgi:preprotein translocase subunit SecA
LQYDDVLNRHRDVIYTKRRNILELADENHVFTPVPALPVEVAHDGEEVDEVEHFASLKSMIMDLIEAEIEHVVSYHTNLEQDESQWNLEEIYETMRTVFPFSVAEKQQMLDLGKGNGSGKLHDVELREAIVEFLLTKARASYDQLDANVREKVGGGGEDATKVVHAMEKALLLRAIDTLWVEHLESVNHVRQGIGLQGYGQRDPLVEYKRETYRLFNDLLSNIQKEVVYSFFKVNIGLELAPSIMVNDNIVLEGAKKDMNDSSGSTQSTPKERTEDGEKVGRNDPCPCGAKNSEGKAMKYKKCHGTS